MLSEQWKTARDIYQRAKKESQKELIASGISAGTASMAPRAWDRRQRFKLFTWNYLSVCATLAVPDELFIDLCDTMNITEKTGVRQVKNRVTAYRKSLPDEKEIIPVDKHDTDYAMIDGRRFWIPPALSQKLLKEIEDYLNAADLSN